MELNENAKKYFYDVLAQKEPIKTETRGKVTTNLYYNFIDGIYTIERKTKRTQWKGRTKDRKHAIELFYTFLYYSMKELEKKINF